jgi:D-alanine-D-alanine ligase
VKPSGEDASVGIDAGVGLRDPQGAAGTAWPRSAKQWDEVLIQEYVAGREVNVGFVGRDILPLSEIVFDRMPAGSWPIVTYAAKWDTGSAEDLGTEPVCPAKLTPELTAGSFQAAARRGRPSPGSRATAGVDLRITDQGEVYVLEVNPNPDSLHRCRAGPHGRARGWEYGELLLRVVEEAVQRSETDPCRRG